MSWTTKKSKAGHWAQVVDAEGSNKLISDGSFKFTLSEGNWYNIRNQTAPSNSFLATAKSSSGDAPTTSSAKTSVFVELSPDESTNKLKGNGLWSFAGSENAYNLVNKD